ncbi:MAG TPA: hypothetical protein VFI41_04820 [Gemmatimonadales bacterium]|nr:hypothetical protein [Gemmatimonadales bacterium]
MRPPANANLSRGQFRQLDTDLRAGGFTHPIAGSAPTAPGFIVSDPGEKRYAMGVSRAADPQRGYSPSRLPQFVRNGRVAFSQPGTYLGGWLESDKGTGKTEAVLDRSRKYPDLPSANRAMRRNDQEAAYDLTQKNYIYNAHHPKNVSRIWENLGRLGQ